MLPVTALLGWALDQVFGSWQQHQFLLFDMKPLPISSINAWQQQHNSRFCQTSCHNDSIGGIDLSVSRLAWLSLLPRILFQSVQLCEASCRSHAPAIGHMNQCPCIFTKLMVTHSIHAWIQVYICTRLYKHGSDWDWTGAALSGALDTVQDGFEIGFEVALPWTEYCTRWRLHVQRIWVFTLLCQGYQHIISAKHMNQKCELSDMHKPNRCKETRPRISIGVNVGTR